LKEDRLPALVDFFGQKFALADLGLALLVGTNGQSFWSHLLAVAFAELVIVENPPDVGALGVCVHAPRLFAAGLAARSHDRIHNFLLRFENAERSCNNSGPW